MNRAIVLMLCLASAGGIAGYTHYTRDTGEPATVYTVPQRAPEPVSNPPAPKAAELPPGDRAALARALQRELKRVGCYSGEITGVWTTSSRMAMKAFTDRVNAALPIDTPDQVLLSLVQGHQDRACGTACPAGQTATESGSCVPTAVLAKAAKPPVPADPPPYTSADKANAALPVAGAATALALAAVPRPEAKATDGTRAAAVKPQEAPVIDKKAPPGERIAPHGGPVPPEGVRERRTRRSGQPAASPPPKFVRNFLKALGFK